MRNTQTHAGRSFRFPLILALCAAFCLTAGAAVAGPPRESDFGQFDDWGECPASGKQKIIRRDSFQAVYMGWDGGGDESGDNGPGWSAVFRLPSGQKVYITCDSDTARKLYGQKRGKRGTVHYEVTRFWPHGDCCVQDSFCVAPRGRR